MKKLMVSMIALIALSGCTNGSIEPVGDEIPENRADMSAYTLLTDTEHQYEELTLGEAVDLIENDEEIVIYLGYPGCSYCQSAVPVLNDAAKEMGKVVYYVNVQSGDENQQASFDRLFVYVEEFLPKNDKGEPAFYVPQIFVAKDGVVLKGYTGIAESATTPTMTDKQKEELKKEYMKMMAMLE